MFELRVESIFSLPRHGSVFAGRVIRGSIGLGDRLICKTPDREIQGRVDGLERSRQNVASATEGEEVAVMCSTIYSEDLKSCYTDEQFFRAGEVSLISAKRWWELS